MATTIRIDIVSAEEEIFSGVGEMITAPAELGGLGITPGHTPLISKLVAGEICIKLSDRDMQAFFVSGGILEVQPHLVTVLADTAIRAKDIDEASALDAKLKAEEVLKDKSSNVDYTTAQTQLSEAMMQLQTLSKFRKRANLA